MLGRGRDREEFSPCRSSPRPLIIIRLPPNRLVSSYFLRSRCGDGGGRLKDVDSCSLSLHLTGLRHFF